MPVLTVEIAEPWYSQLQEMKEVTETSEQVLLHQGIAKLYCLFIGSETTVNAQLETASLRQS